MKRSRANQLPASLSAKRTAAFRSARRRLGRRCPLRSSGLAGTIDVQAAGHPRGIPVTRVRADLLQSLRKTSSRLKPVPSFPALVRQIRRSSPEITSMRLLGSSRRASLGHRSTVLPFARTNLSLRPAGQPAGLRRCSRWCSSGSTASSSILLVGATIQSPGRSVPRLRSTSSSPCPRGQGPIALLSNDGRRLALARNHVVNRHHLRLARIHASLLQNRHQRLTKTIERLLRVPDLEHCQLVASAEASVIQTSRRYSGASGFELPDEVSTAARSATSARSRIRVPCQPPLMDWPSGRDSVVLRRRTGYSTRMLIERKAPPTAGRSGGLAPRSGQEVAWDARWAGCRFDAVEDAWECVDAH